MAFIYPDGVDCCAVTLGKDVSIMSRVMRLVVYEKKTGPVFAMYFVCSFNQE